MPNTTVCALRLLALLALLAAPLTAAEQAGGGEAIDHARQLGDAFAGIAERVAPAVVSIAVERSTPAAQPRLRAPGPGGERFFGPGFPGPRGPGGGIQRGQGSGFIVSTDGYILSNHHVVGDADRVTVSLNDGREFEAEVVGSDEHSDVALIKIDANDLPVLPYGSSAALRVGEWVLAVGSPFGLQHSVTAGIVSAKGRDRVGIANYEDFIQTDAAINPGNSGGPLVNLDGEVIGINTAIFSRSGGSMGIGFAIPIDLARPLVEQLRESGTVNRGFLGVIIQDLDADLAESFALETAEGVIVTQIQADSPAERGGLEVGDVVLEFEGRRVVDVGSFRNRVAAHAPGSEVTMTIRRGDETRELTVELGNLEAGSVSAEAQENPSAEHLGFTVTTLSEALAQRLGYEDRRGVLVESVADASPAARAGLRPGLLVEQVAGDPVGSVAEFRAAIAGLEAGDLVRLLVRSPNGARFLAFRLPEAGS